MKHTFFLSLLISILVFSSLQIFAQAPLGVNYQAAIRDNSGVSLLGQTVSVRFTIHQTTASGVAVFQETHVTTTNQFGLVNLKIGSVNTTDFPLINWSTGTYFLQIEVDAGTGFEDLGATQLLSVPYALFAESAGNGPQGLSSLMDTNSVLSVICPNGGKRVLMGLDGNSNGVLDVSEITSSFVVCNGADGLAGLSINWQGQVATAPLTPSTNDAYYNTTDGVSYIYNGASWDTLTAGGTGSVDADWVVNGVDMYSDPAVSGHVGIGTNTPLKKLHIESSFNGGDGVLLNSATAIGDPGIEFQTQGVSQFVLGVDQSDNNKFKIGTSGVNVNPRFVIDNQGKVGIGTVNPAYQLDVSSPDSVVSAFRGTNTDASVILVSNTNSNAALGTIYVSGTDSGIVVFDPLSNRMALVNTTPGGNTTISADSAVAVVGDFFTVQANQSIYHRTDTMYHFSGTGNIMNVNQGSFLTDSLYVLGNNATNPNWILANDGGGQAIWTDPSTLGLGGGLWQSSAPNIYFNTGNVSIGTAATSSNLLTLAGSIGTRLLKLEGNGSSASGFSIEYLGLAFGGYNIRSDEPGGIHFEATGSGVSDRISFEAGNNERMRITGSGNVGIGTNTPTSNLDVNGTFKLTDGTEGANKILTSDGLGNATWQAPTGGLWTQGTGSDVYNNTDSIGIGVVDPKAPLHVSGGGLGQPIALFEKAGFLAATININHTGSNSSGINFQNGGTTTSSIISTTSNVMGLSASSVDIGSSSTPSKMIVNSQSTVTSPTLQLHEASTGFSRIKHTNTVAGGKYWITEAGLNTIDAQSGYSIAYNDGGTTKIPFIIYGDNKVGINNLNAPFGIFHVTDNNGSFSMFEGMNQPGEIKVSRSNQPALTRQAILIGENIGNITFAGATGTTFGSGPQISARATENFLGSSNGSELVFKTILNGTTVHQDALRLLNDGTVEVPVNLRVLAGAGTAGNVLTSDAAGNATWQSPGGGDADWTAGTGTYYNANDLIGIGTTAPLFKLDVDPGASYAGPLVRIRNTNASSLNEALQVLSNGAGPSINLTQTGSGHGQGITLSNVTNSNYALQIRTDGLSNGIDLVHSGSSAGASRNGIRSLVNGSGGSQNTGGNFSASGATISNTGISASASASNSSQATGIYATAGGSTSGTTYGVYGQNTSSTSGVAYGGYFQSTNSTANLVYGVRADVNSSSPNNQYGLAATMGTASAGTKYGVYSLVTGGTTNWAGYFAGGNVFVQDSIGIGTINPEASLDVAGTFKLVDGTEGAGKLLTSDAAGNATWQNSPQSINFSVNTSGTGIPPAVTTPLIFDNVEYDSSGDFNIGTGQFVATVAGVYHVDAVVTFDSSTNYEIQLQILRNGGTHKMVIVYADPSKSFITAHISADVYLPALNNVSIGVYQNSGGTITPTGLNTISRVYFTGHLVR